MITTLTTLMLVLPMHTSSSTSAADRAAHAAEHAAEAAAAAAESMARAAAAMEKIAAGMGASAAAPSTAPAPAAAAVADAEADLAVWTANIGANMVLFAGNSETIAIGTDISVERKTADWILTGKLAGGYGESTSPTTGASDTTALFLATSLRADFRFNEMVSAYAAALVDTDHVKAIEYRAGGEGGASVQWFEQKVDDYVKAAFKTDLALRAQYESRFQYFPQAAPVVILARTNLDDVSLVAPRLGLSFVYGITKDATFTEDAEILPNVIPDPAVDGTRVLINSASKLSFKLTTALSFNSALVLKFDNIPAAGKDDLDVQLTVGLSVTL